MCRLVPHVVSWLFLLQIISLQDQMEPFCQKHVKSCDGKLQDALRPYTQGSQQQAVHHRVIFTDAPHQYNTVALREELLAAALMGSSSNWAEVHAVLAANEYILTLDYMMKMVHLEVCHLTHTIQTHTIQTVDADCAPLHICLTFTPKFACLCCVPWWYRCKIWYQTNKVSHGYVGRHNMVHSSLHVLTRAVAVCPSWGAASQQAVVLLAFGCSVLNRTDNVLFTTCSTKDIQHYGLPKSITTVPRRHVLSCNMLLRVQWGSKALLFN